MISVRNSFVSSNYPYGSNISQATMNAKTQNNQIQTRRLDLQQQQSQQQQSSSNNNSVRSAFDVFVSNDHDFQICFPANWSVVSSEPGQVIFVAPRSNPQQFCENLSVVRENLDERFNNLQIYTSAVVDQIKNSQLGTVLQSQSSHLGGLMAHEVVYCTNDGLIFKQNWIIHNGRAYVVSFVSQHKQFHSANKLVTELILSFRLLA